MIHKPDKRRVPVVQVYECSLEEYCASRDLNPNDFERHKIISYYRSGRGLQEGLIQDAERRGYAVIVGAKHFCGAIPGIRGFGIKRRLTAEILD